MRIVQRVAHGVALALMVPALASAQSPSWGGGNFKDSWFWGAKIGAVSFSTTAVENRVRPMAGAEWLITRTRGALYISFDQSLFSAASALTDSSGQRHDITMHDMRRFTAAALAFPFDLGPIRPYGGLGLALNFIRSATLDDNSFADPLQEAEVRALLKEQRDRAALVAIVGTQIQVWRVAVFGQATAMPASTGFLLNGRPTYFAEAGIRINTGTSRESMKR